MHQVEIDAQPRRRLESRARTQRQLVPPIGVVTTQKPVLAEAIAPRALRHQSPGGVLAGAGGQRIARHDAEAGQSVAAGGRLETQFTDRARLAGLDLD